MLYSLIVSAFLRYFASVRYPEFYLRSGVWGLALLGGKEVTANSYIDKYLVLLPDRICPLLQIQLKGKFDMVNPDIFALWHI